MKYMDGSQLMVGVAKAIVLVPSLLLVGCLDSGSGGGTSSDSSTSLSLVTTNQAKVGIFLGADPTSPSSKQVVVSVDRVSIRDENEDSVSVAGSGQQVELTSNNVALPNLNLTADQVLVSREIRLILMPTGNTYTRTDGSICQLKTPSAQESGLKIKLPDDYSFETGFFYSIHLEFDVDKSVVDLGNGGCLLKPVVKGEIIAYKPPVDNGGGDSSGGDSSGGSSDGSGSGGSGDVPPPVVDYQPDPGQVIDTTVLSVSNY